jgi:hypothetical protein
MEPPAAWVAAAEGEDATGEPVTIPLEGVEVTLLGELDDPPHAATRAVRATAPAAQPAAARNWTPV